MAGLSVYSLASALNASGQLLTLLLTWLMAAALTAFAAPSWRTAPPAGTRLMPPIAALTCPAAPCRCCLFWPSSSPNTGLASSSPCNRHLVQATGFTVNWCAVYGFSTASLPPALLWACVAPDAPPAHTAQQPRHRHMNHTPSLESTTMDTPQATTTFLARPRHRSPRPTLRGKPSWLGPPRHRLRV